MSASREKKQRKGDPEVLTQKQRQEQQEQQAAKRKTMLYAVIGVVVAVLVVVLLLWNSGIFEKKLPAAVVNGQEFSVEDLNYYYQAAINQEYNTYAQLMYYGISMPFDLSRPLSEQIYDAESGKTYQQYFQEQALETLKQVTALCDKANAEGYTLSQEAQEAIDGALQSIDNYSAQNNMSRSTWLTRYYGKGMTEAIYLRNLRSTILASDYQNHHLEGLTYDDGQLQDYYKEHAGDLDSYDFRYFYVDGAAEDPTDDEGNPMTDADGNPITATEEDQAAALAAAKERADAAAKEIRAAALSAREQAFIDLAPDYVPENAQERYRSDPDASLNSGVLGSNLSSYYAEWLKDSGRKAGDVSVLEGSGGYYVVLFLDRYLVEDPTVNYQNLLFTAALTQQDNPDTTDVDESRIPAQADMDAAKSAAEALLAQWQAGEATAESFAALASEQESASYNSYSYAQQAGVPEDLGQWLFDSARKDGDTTLLEVEDSGWRLVCFDKQEVPYWSYTASNALRQADHAAWLEELTAPYEAQAADGMASVGN